MSKEKPTPTPSSTIEPKSRILWLAPDKPENLSIGRARIANGLRQKGYAVNYQPRRLAHVKTQLTADYDVLIGTTSLAGILGMETGVNGKTFIVDHIDPISQMRRTAGRTKAKLVETLQDVAFRLADGIMYVYDEEAQRVYQSDAHVSQTTLGVDYDRFQNPTVESTDYIAQRLATYDITGRFAVYLGGLEDIYNIPELLNSAKRNGYQLVIAGQGKYEKACWKASARHENIHYVGSIPHEHVPALLEKASVGISLVNDPHTVKVLEYGAAGLPTVHVNGRAEGILPDAGIQWTGLDPSEIGKSVRLAYNYGSTDGLEEYAKNRRWSDVVDQYQRVIEQV
jgi:glycosyltransferase involved in cell wall biosynthesis